MGHDYITMTNATETKSTETVTLRICGRVMQATETPGGFQIGDAALNQTAAGWIYRSPSLDCPVFYHNQEIQVLAR